MSRSSSLLFAVSLFTALLMVNGCSPSMAGKEADPTATTVAGEAAQNSESEVTQNSGSVRSTDIGSVSYADVKAVGVGPTPTMAIDEALYSAIRQVNGASISGTSVQYTGATYIRSSLGDIDIKSAGFAEAIVSASSGSVSAFSIDEGSPAKLNESAGGIDDQWRVAISAKIAKYNRPDASLRPALIVAVPRIDRISVSAGSFSEEAFAAAVKQHTEDAIGSTNRFAVVNRALTGEALAELSLAQSGLSPIEQEARVGQLLSAEVVVVPTVHDATYTKSVRELKTSDRNLVSFNAGLDVRYDVINATTGQTIFSKSYQISPVTPQPTTLGASVNPQRELETALIEITAEFISDLNRRTFPVSVIAIDGDIVVLSQGGSSLQTGTTYQAIKKGVEYTDPQTGQSLGRQETQIGTVLVDRTDVSISYGVLTPSTGSELTNFKPGEIELRDAVSENVQSSNEENGPTKTSVQNVRSHSANEIESSELDGAQTGPEEQQAEDSDW